MLNGRYTLVRSEVDEDTGKIWLTYKTPFGGSILLSHSGLGEPDWNALPEDFPLEQAKNAAKTGLLR